MGVAALFRPIQAWYSSFGELVEISNSESPKSNSTGHSRAREDGGRLMPMTDERWRHFLFFIDPPPPLAPVICTSHFTYY